MNRSEFISYIQNPSLVKVEEFSSLNALVQKYRYFQTAQLLYLKVLHDAEDVAYSEHLKVAAAYASDRKVLYELIKKEYPKQQEAFVNAPQIKEPEKKEVVISSPVVLPNDEPFEKRIEQLVEDKLKQLSEKIEENARSVTQKLDEVANAKQQELKEVPIQKPERKPLPRDFEIVYSIERSLGDEKVKETIKDATAQKTDELTKDILSKAIDAGVEIEAANYIADDKKLPVSTPQKKEEQKKPAEEPQQPVVSSKRSFTDWLKSSKHISSENQRDEERRDMLQMIDKFIKEEPRISKPKSTFFSAEAMGKKSVEMDEDLITETLAKVFVKQKNYVKAINAYRILSLKYPEKSAFFATQISELKNIINQNKT